MNIRAPPPFVPPRPQPPAQSLGLFRLFGAIRTNLLTVWPAAAFEEDVVVGSGLLSKIFLINAPDAIHRVLVENTANYRRSAVLIRVAGPIVGNGLLLSEGDGWRQQRRTIAPAFAQRVIPMLARHVASAAEAEIARLAAAPGAPVDVLASMRFLALETAARSMFSLEMAQYGPALHRMIEDFFVRLGQPTFLDVMLPVAIPTLRDFRRRLFRRRWIALVDEIVAARLNAPPSDKPRDLFDVLHAARDPETGAAFSREQLRDQTATMIVGANETASLALFWCLYLLAMAPAEQERMADEVRSLDLGPEHAAEALPKLAYTRAVVNEALRLFPSIWAMARVARGPDRVGDITIPRGAIITISPWILHRHRKLWRDPDAFIPSRFLAGKPQRFSYLPFGIGPRVCVGAQFALTEVVLVLAAMIKRFRIALADAGPVLPVASLTCHPDRAARFHLDDRSIAHKGLL
jgi:unspecific monooxygenase